MGTKPAIQAKEDKIETRRRSKPVRGKIIYLIVIVAIIGVGSYFSLSQIAPSYVSQATILIEPGEAEISENAGGSQPAAALVDQEALASQVQLLRSRGLAGTVIDKTGLEDRAEFNPTLRASTPVSNFLATIGLGIDPFRSPVEELALQRFAKNLSVYPVDNSQVIAIEFAAQDPQLAADVANGLAEEFIALHRTAKRDATVDASKWLASEIISLGGRVRDVDVQLEAFRAANSIAAFSAKAPATPQSQLAGLNVELAGIDSARSEIQARIDRIRARLNSGAALNRSEVLDSQLIRRLVETKLELSAESAQLFATQPPENLQLSEISARVADLDRQIREEVEKILEGLEAEAQASQARAAEIHQRLSEITSPAIRANAPELSLWALEREAAAQRDLLDSYVSRYRMAVAWRRGDYLPANAQIISLASAPSTPQFVNIGAAAIAASALVMLFGIGFILVRDRAISARLRRGLLASQPPVPKDGKSRWTDDDPVRRMMPADPTFAPKLDSSVEEPAAVVADRIIAAAYKRVLVTTAGGAGNSRRPLAAVAIARAIARMERRAVLIDLRPDGGNSISMGEARDLPGFFDLFTGAASFAQVIFRDRKSRVHFIPGGSHSLSSQDILDERVARLISALDHTYDHVVLDLADDIVEAMAAACEVAVVVTEFDEADPQTVRTAELIRANSKARIIYLPIDPAGAGDVATDIEELASGEAA